MNANLSSPAPFLLQPTAGSTVNGLGAIHIYKARSIDTAENFSSREAVVLPGAGAPSHTHARDDEAFFILGGEPGAIEGKRGFLAVWGTQPPDWAAPAMPREPAMRRWRHAAAAGSLAMSIPILTVLLMWFFRVG